MVPLSARSSTDSIPRDNANATTLSRSSSGQPSVEKQRLKVDGEVIVRPPVDGLGMG